MGWGDDDCVPFDDQKVGDEWTLWEKKVGLGLSLV
jgi:hypothetical protein